MDEEQAVHNRQSAAQRLWMTGDPQQERSRSHTEPRDWRLQALESKTQEDVVWFTLGRVRKEDKPEDVEKAVLPAPSDKPHKIRCSLFVFLCL